MRERETESLYTRSIFVIGRICCIYGLLRIGEERKRGRKREKDREKIREREIERLYTSYISVRGRIGSIYGL